MAQSAESSHVIARGFGGSRGEARTEPRPFSSTTRTNAGKIVATFFSLMVTAPLDASAQVSAVAIKAGKESGSGYAVRRGEDCIVITASHVIQTAATMPDERIRIYDESGAEAGEAKLVFQDQAADVAIVRVPASRTFTCESAWQDGGAVQSVLREAASGTVNMQIVTMREGGESDVNAVTFAGSSGPKNFRVRAPGDTIAKGRSGSVVVSDGRILGITLSNNDGTVRVLRQDHIHSLAKSYAEVEGVRILLMPLLNKGREVEVAGTSARKTLEVSGGISVREAPPEWIDARTGNAKQTGDAQYVLRGKVLSSQVTRTTSGIGVAQDLGRNRSLGDLGKSIGDLGKLGQNFGLKPQVDNHTLQLELSLTTVASGEAITEMVTRAATFPYGANHTAEINSEIDKAVAEGVTALLRRAGIAR